ncbi:MAG: ATP synthase F1 subunit delta [candidate division Zixibacteria bacterium]|nr:ATP synthase F1 subunit delta [candidate division Zixibacteria bacterium]
MLAQEVAKKYSTALFNIVNEKGLIDEAFEQFEELDKLINSDASLLQFLLAPHILDQNKITLLRDVFTQRLNPLFLEFLLVLISKHRIGFLHEIIEEFRWRVANARGMLVAKVTTAIPLNDADRASLIAKLASRTGKSIELEEKVDSAILGGMIVILGDQIIDGSVKHGLALLKEDLMKLSVN